MKVNSMVQAMNKLARLGTEDGRGNIFIKIPTLLEGVIHGSLERSDGDYSIWFNSMEHRHGLYHKCRIRFYFSKSDNTATFHNYSIKRYATDPDVQRTMVFISHLILSAGTEKEQDNESNT